METPARPTAATSAAAAAWVVESVRNFDYTVGSVVPAYFEAYARVFHPASRREGVEVRWADVADAYGRTMHPVAEWGSLTGTWSEKYPPRHPICDDVPAIGNPPQRLRMALADVLERHTRMPERCWFAVWEGWSGIDALDAPRFTLPSRPMLLFEGPVSAAGVSLHQHAESPNLWWPEDRAWCVGSEIDLMTTYVGGSDACISAILADPRLEALRASVDQLVTWEADTINPLPAPPGTGSV